MFCLFLNRKGETGTPTVDRYAIAILKVVGQAAAWALLAWVKGVVLQSD